VLVLVAALLSAGAILYPGAKELVATLLSTWQPLVINLDHGLADCPWPEGVDPFDPSGEVRVENRVIVLRTDARVYLKERVNSVVCYSAYLFGPAIDIDIKPDVPPLRDDPAPPLNPEMDWSGTDLPAALTAYRTALRLMDQFDLTPDQVARGRKSLDHWYSEEAHTSHGGASLGFLGTLASGGVDIRLTWEPKVQLGFAFATVNPPPHPVDLSDGALPPYGSLEPPIHRPICIRLPQDGGPSGQPPPRSQAEIDRSRFKPCP
jgi:hypothetical protein